MAHGNCNITSISYLDLHASDRFAELKHDKDQTWVNWLPAAGAGLLSTHNKQHQFFSYISVTVHMQFIVKLDVSRTFLATARCISCRKCGGTQLSLDI